MAASRLQLAGTVEQDGAREQVARAAADAQLGEHELDGVDVPELAGARQAAHSADVSAAHELERALEVMPDNAEARALLDEARAKAAESEGSR